MRMLSAAPWPKPGGRDSGRDFGCFLVRGNYGDIATVVNRVSEERHGQIEVLKTVRLLGRTERARRGEQSALVDEVRTMLRVSAHLNVLQPLGCFLWGAFGAPLGHFWLLLDWILDGF